jgi:5-methylthioadenosine/S-adenosylhomocysteine deaminase
MATTGGAAAIGRAEELGAITVGRKADLVAVRTDTPRMTPLLPEGSHPNVHHNLVHAVRGSDVDLTMVDGRIVVRDGQLVEADLTEIIARVRSLVPGLFARRAEWLAQQDELDGLFHG